MVHDHTYPSEDCLYIVFSKDQILPLPCLAFSLAVDASGARVRLHANALADSSSNLRWCKIHQFDDACFKRF